MADIIINEISQNYTYNIGTNSYACVALPITASWGPGFFDPAAAGLSTMEDMLEQAAWERYPATQAGLEAFVAAYRGPATNYRLVNNYSYQMAMTLLTAGYDVLVCRICPGTKAQGAFAYYDKINEEPADWSTNYSDYYTFVGNTPVPVAGVEGKVALTSEPADWSTNYANYYRLNDNNEYVVVTGEPAKILLQSQPDDWASNYASYYVATGTGTYDHVQGVNHYRKVASNATEPADWAITYNTDYYVDNDGVYELNQESDFITARDNGIYYVDAIVAPTWEAGIYYEDGLVAPDFVANQYFKSDIVAPTFDKDAGYYGQKEGSEGASAVTLKAKYPGSFGNNLVVELRKSTRKKYDGAQKKFVDIPYWNMITYVVDAMGAKSAVENIVFSFDFDNCTDTIPYWEEVESKFVELAVPDEMSDDDVILSTTGTGNYITLSGGTDWMDAPAELPTEITKLIKGRFKSVNGSGDDYVNAMSAFIDAKDTNTQMLYYNMEWVYTMLVGMSDETGTTTFDGVYSVLKDKLAYNHNRVISPGWDDQNIAILTEEATAPINELSPIHVRLMDIAYYSRCATAYIDTPYSLARGKVYTSGSDEGYVQKLSEYAVENLTAADINYALYSSHSAFFAPWGQYRYVGTAKQLLASPGFIALMIERAQILNQAIQYEWALPTNRSHTLKLGKLQYPVPKKLLDIWQKQEGVGVNVITNIPGLGTNIWGNSTLFDLPPATYQALANLSTRKLVNAVEDVAYRCGIAITFQYNNLQAYNKFYAGVTPLLDTMKNVGAIEGYRVEMAADINGLDHVNANSVVGKIWLLVNGVINDISIDLIALPAGAGIDLNTLS